MFPLTKGQLTNKDRIVGLGPTVVMHVVVGMVMVPGLIHTQCSLGIKTTHRSVINWS